MRRPWAIWSVFAGCLVVVLSGTGYISARAIELDRKDAAAARQAALEENVRLAQWRMQAALMPILGRENARPYFEYAAFYPLERAYTNMLMALKFGDVLVPSPLLTFQSPYVKLHFQLDLGSGELSSPQAPTGNMLDLAQGRYGAAEQIDRAARELAQLRQIAGVDALRLLAMQCPAPRDPAPVAGSEEELELQPHREGDRLVPHAGDIVRFQRQSEQVQQQLNDADWQRRKSAQSKYLETSKTGSRVVPSDAVRQQSAESQAGGAGQAAAPPTARAQQQEAPQPSAAAQQSAQPAPSDEVIALEGEATALFVADDQLLLLRRVSVNAQQLLQGCWLDWPAVRSMLLAEVADLLPNAQLVPIRADQPTAGAVESRLLAGVPLRLIPGALPGDGMAISSSTRLSLLIAWACVLLAVAAVMVLLKAAVSLSERRADFVSAVTHELRTPLTTFRMYTQMLSDGMVTDAAKRQAYLETLRGEADRLGHLVENVLAYARLERSNGPSRQERLTVVDLLGRVEQRLRRRVEQGGMAWVVEVAEGANGATLQVDPTAVEQILFNLVDNACKYANHEDQADRRVELSVEAEADGVRFRVTDHGRGVEADVRDRLFRPFSKSAHAAANSAPGVGLGLALCKRLAERLNGSLTLERSGESGATFTLTLPRST